MGRNRKRIERIDRHIIVDVIRSVNSLEAIPLTDQVEMAIPSYLNENPFVRAMFWRRYDVVYRLAQLKPEMIVCEFGCGIGVFLPTLVKEVDRVYAVDLFPQYAREIARKFKLSISFLEDLSELPDDSMDIIFAVEVMEHLDDPIIYTQLFARKLKPNGRLIMSGPTESGLYKFGRTLVGYNKYHDYHENNVFQLNKIISENGFTLERIIRYPSPILPLYLIGSFQVEK
jgi:2-polyprenyl-3-methyl-5-hydroxy-6-metoxy-1,4-benzoquinol methylase